MSFVSIVARENFLCVMSDGRVQGVNGEILQEDYQKFIKIENRAFVAFAGSKTACEELAIQVVPHLYTNASFTSLALEIKGAFERSDYEDYGTKVAVSFGGVNRVGEIEYHAVNSLTKKTMKYAPRGDDITYCFLQNGEALHQLKLEQELINIMRETGFKTPSQVIQAQKLLNNKVADIDSSVNKVTSRMIIKKE